MELLKQDWSSADRFNYTDINNMYNTINILLKKLEIYSVFEKRHIKTGDDLSGKTLYLEFPDNLEEAITNSMTSSEQIDEKTYERIVAATKQGHRIVEKLEILLRFQDSTVKADSDILYMGEAGGWRELINEQQYKLAQDFGTVQYVNSASSSYQYIYVKGVEEKGRGDFLFVEDLEIIEENISKISRALATGYVARKWYKLSTFSYKDVNRWATAINNAITIMSKQSEVIASQSGEKVTTEDINDINTEGGEK